MTGNELCTCGHRLKEHDGEDFDCACGCLFFIESGPLPPRIVGGTDYGEKGASPRAIRKAERKHPPLAN